MVKQGDQMWSFDTAILGLNMINLALVAKIMIKTNDHLLKFSAILL